MPPVRPFFAIACMSAVLVACSSPPEPAAAPAPVAADAGAPVRQDESGLRQAAAAALDEQRIYTPAGDSAIEHYLALRRLQPGDAGVDTALLELLPYALIATEQAVGRGDLAEARRLVALIGQVDPQAPALSRLHDGIAAAEAEADRRIVAAAEAAKRDELLAAQAAVRAEEQVRSRPDVAPAPPTAAPSSAVVAPAVTRAAPEMPAAVGQAPAPAPGAAQPVVRVPRLLDAPSPRYPLSALRRKIEGSVTVEFTAQPDGSVSSPRVLTADPAGLFDEAALAAASRWRFERLPAAVTTARIVQFRLGDGAR
ncbi:energy transducer TonB [Arenimonas terrae]|nr:energy transducer TonB [Arenimonas terrae]